MIELRWRQRVQVFSDPMDGEIALAPVLQFRTYIETSEEVLENGVRGFRPKKVTTEWQDVPTVRED